MKLQVEPGISSSVNGRYFDWFKINKNVSKDSTILINIIFRVNEQGINGTSNSSMSNISISTVTSSWFENNITTSIMDESSSIYSLENSQNISEITTEQFTTTLLNELNNSTEESTDSWFLAPIRVNMFSLYIIAILLSTIFVIVRCFVTYYYTIKVSNNIHKSMATNILLGCMTFFDTNLIGNILTRFSRDLYMMDELVPFIWLEGFRVSAELLGSCNGVTFDFDI